MQLLATDLSNYMFKDPENKQLLNHLFASVVIGLSLIPMVLYSDHLPEGARKNVIEMLELATACAIAAVTTMSAVVHFGQISWHVLVARAENFKASKLKDSDSEAAALRILIEDPRLLTKFKGLLLQRLAADMPSPDFSEWVLGQSAEILKILLNDPELYEKFHDGMLEKLNSGATISSLREVLEKVARTGKGMEAVVVDDDVIDI